MTTVTAIAPTALTSTSRRTEPTTITHRQTLGRAIHSEWIKLRTLRSTWIGMGGVVVVLVGLGAIAAAVSTGSVTTPEDGGGFVNGDPLSTVLTGADFGGAPGRSPGRPRRRPRVRVAHDLGHHRRRAPALAGRRRQGRRAHRRRATHGTDRCPGRLRCRHGNPLGR